MEDLSVSIVTYNSEKELPRILKSLKETKDISFSVTVVDNASADGSCRTVRTLFPEAEIILMDRNLGYGKANNAAIRKSSAKYQLVVNPDVGFAPDFLARCVRFMDEHEDVAMLSPKVFFPDGREQYLPKKKPSPAYLAGGVIEKMTGRENKLRSSYTLRNEAVGQMRDIDFCTGCFMLMRGDAVRSLNGFDESFFLYFEDADLTLRMQAWGRTVYVPSLTIIHEWNRGNMKTAGITHEMASMIRYFYKWR